MTAFFTGVWRVLKIVAAVIAIVLVIAATIIVGVWYATIRRNASSGKPDAIRPISDSLKQQAGRVDADIGKLRDDSNRISGISEQLAAANGKLREDSSRAGTISDRLAATNLQLREWLRSVQTGG